LVQQNLGLSKTT